MFVPSLNGFGRRYTRSSLRATALSGSSTLVLALVAGLLVSAPAQAGCTLSAGVETCTGNLSGAGGVNFGNPPVSQLDVMDLTTADIAPAGGTVGIGLTGSGGNGGDGNDGAFGIGVGDGHSGHGGPDITVSYNSNSPFQVVTSGNNGIFGLSVGGRGGSGGTGYLAGDGGDGGRGGNGGRVVITSWSLIDTTADHAAGILAVSNGGRGGTGGDADISLGGSGGLGGAGGGGGRAEVDMNAGTITTTGNDSVGIGAQSLGGAGGDGGSGAGIFISAGSGGGAAAGGEAVVNTLQGTVINTSGNDSHGILAQSIGGFGGGAGGGGGLVVFGSGGGSGGDGGTALVDSFSTITTQGEHAYGIFAESIGGGGGDGGTSGGLVALGSSGGGGGAASSVRVTNRGTIHTYGYNSIGLAAFSIGGGGGDGGPSGGLVALGGSSTYGSPGGSVIVDNRGAITTELGKSEAIFAQSIGGGGGNGDGAGGLVAIGGNGGAGGNGGSVTVGNSADLMTKGVRSDVIFAQSIGGGGGNGDGAGGLVAIGASGSAGGSGGSVSVTNSATLTALSERSSGIFAQSIGGGGGNGGSSGGFVALGGGGSPTSDGGSVAVDNSGNISVAGGQSYAVFAQSVGGGGGNGGSSGGMFSIGGTGGGGGSGHDVTVMNAADLTTDGLDSAALVAQSVGGGGGNGGNSVAVGAWVSVSVGGGGGSGGSGGVVHVNCTSVACANLGALGASTITTYQDSSAGIFAQSVGGGGGNGGFAISLSVGLYGSASFGVGGHGSTGGNASEVVVGAKGTVETQGDFSNGIEAESVGGGGGDGGFAVSVTGSTGGSLALGLGGSGGSGGSAGTATIHSLADVTTSGDFSSGVLASSIGGGGGNGGMSIAGSGAPYAAAALSFGGNGGSGGAGSDVSVTNEGSIATSGNFANGITAESIGGGGGNGGLSVSAAISQYAAVGLAFGGDGAAGSHAGAVVVDNSGFITTSGLNSYGILAQSVGGGGGNGGFAAGLGASLDGVGIGVAVGGTGAAGADGGTVDVTSTASVWTTGTNAVGIFAQSVGGGGGSGGFSIAAALSSDGLAGALGIGGAGGDGGMGGNVNVDASDGIWTTGDLAHGILAQSVGGGGGRGGFSIGASVSLDSSAGTMTIGGQGGGGHDAGTVIVTTHDYILTGGVNSNGILAQSIGGGGGDGGFSIGGSFSFGGMGYANTTGGDGGTAGDGSTVEVHKLDGWITTTMDNANAIFAQSVGGGGGNGAFSVAGSISDDDANATTTGGKGGAAGAGGAVTVENIGDLTTSGNLSNAILAQSVGGGGGNGGWAIGGSLSVSGGGESNATGGAGGASGLGGNVVVTSNGDLMTSGDGSAGILAQSVGGGGGNGGFSGALAIGLDGGGTTNSVGGDAGGAADGASKSGTVTVTTTSGNSITTSGDNATAIIAQSIGGGGGNGGFSAAISGSTDDSTASSVGGKGGTGQDGDTVMVHNYAMLTASGALSNGILAQSVGGGGGNGGFSLAGSLSTDKDGASSSVGGTGGAGGKGGQVQVDNHATISIGGSALPDSGGSVGILAQSIGGGGGNGGFSGALSLSTSGNATTNSVGGDGGTGADADTVTVSNGAGIETWAANSSGILAQSVGGSGGNGGFSLSAAFTSESDGENQTVGGTGGVAAAGSDVTVALTEASTIVTHGDLSYGVLAQSIGGGGGNGGFAVGGTLSLGGDSSSNVTGGSGSGGGGSGVVDVNNAGMIATVGQGSIGIFAQSVGGGGGSGAFAGGLSISTGGDAENTVGGGTGSGGGSGGQVTVENSGLVWTQAQNSIGILAQSVGGGGGNGGFSIAASGASGDGSNNSVGGAAAGGGNGGFVHVTNSGSIVTGGALSYGILAQSVGGGGGNGGFSIEGTLAEGSGGHTQSVGGAGGAGGDGGNVQVDNTGSIVLWQSGSVGVLAQSIGGGGGTGGFNAALAISGGSVDQTVGGAGGTGGDGGDVVVNSTGDITTYAANSIGVLAQSIGGGGGYGGINISVATGDASGTSLDIGSRSSGGSNGTVTVHVTGDTTVETHGALSNALLAQGIGGGGGFGGFVVDDPLLLGPAGATLFLGAHGAGGGDGTATTPTNSNNLVTTGAGALGAVSQSIGGGGGHAGQTGDYDLGTDVLTLSATLGGDSTGGGNGDLSALTNTGDISTGGDNALALASQSIGGGGGIASFSFGILTGQPLGVVLQLGGSEGLGGDGAVAQLVTQGATSTTGNLATALLLQSIGGGGGYGSLAVQSGMPVGANGVMVNLGATGGPGGSSSGGTGAATDAQIDGGTIMTTGNGSLGVVAQSIGGGGGFAATSGADAAATVMLGASGGAGGDGGVVTVDSAAAISTTGVYAHAIVAQSIGGGGGLFVGLTEAGVPISTTVDGNTGGAGGDGGAVVVSNTAAISTTGVGAHGIVAQSIGGGGGLVGGGDFYPMLPHTGAFAGTVGGTGSGAAVGVSTSADILAVGAGATGIFVQSEGGSGGTGMTVDVGTDVTVSGGTGTGHAVAMYGGVRNILTNRGMLLTQPLLAIEPQDPLLGQSAAQNVILNTGIEEFVVVGTFGDDIVNNTGSIYGNVNMQYFGPYNDINIFNNLATGYFAPGSTVVLGGAATSSRLVNDGWLSPGDFYNIKTTDVTGNFTQSSSGTYLLDIDLDPNTTDRINMTGEAVLDGTVHLSFNNPGWAAPGSYDRTILSAADGRGGTTFAALASPPSAVFTPSLTYPNATDADLSYDIDFSPMGLTVNQHSVGDGVNAIQTAGVPAFRIVAAQLFFIPTVPQLGVTYDSLSGEGVSGIQQAIFYSRQQFFGVTMMNASVALGAGAGPFALASNPSAGTDWERWRFWVSGVGGSGYMSGRTNVGSAKNDYGNIGGAAGAEYRIDDTSLVGIALSGEQANFTVPDRYTHGHGVGFNFGVYGMRRFCDDWYASGVLSYGNYDNYETRWHVGIGLDAVHPWTYINQPLTPIPQETTQGKFRSQNLGGQFEVGYKYVYESVNLTPYVNIQFDNQWVGKFSETSVVSGTSTPGILGLYFGSLSVASVPLSLGVQADGSFSVGDGMTMVPAVRLAWRHEFETKRPVDAEFLLAPGFGFTTWGAEAMRDAFHTDVGLLFNVSTDVSLYADFKGDFSHSGTDMGGQGGLKVRF